MMAETVPICAESETFFMMVLTQKRKDAEAQRKCSGFSVMKGG
jgi:hypothetical protein